MENALRLYELTCNEEFFPTDQEHLAVLCTNICPVDRAIYPHARLAAQAKLNPSVRFAMCNLHAIANRIWGIYKQMVQC